MTARTSIVRHDPTRTVSTVSIRKQRGQIPEQRLIDDLLGYMSCAIETVDQLAHLPDLQSYSNELKNVRRWAGRHAATATAISTRHRSEAMFHGIIDCLHRNSKNVGSIYVNEQVAIQNEDIRMAMPALRPSEARLLFFLVKNAGQYASPELLAQVAGSRSAGTKHVKVQISRIRSNLKKLGLLDPIETCTGRYRFRALSLPTFLDLFAGFAKEATRSS